MWDRRQSTRLDRQFPEKDRDCWRILEGGILQSPFFDVGFPEAVNYGALGAVAGHEVTHAFDDRGRQRDGKGNLRNWWTPQSEANFRARAECLVEEYSAFAVPGTDVRVDGRQTIGENIADVGGLNIAYQAYLERKAELGPEEASLPDLEHLSGDQLFFLAHAQTWCSEGRPEANLRRALSGLHTHPKWRVNGPARNLPEFARAFACPLNSPMNPPNKCAVW